MASSGTIDATFGGHPFILRFNWWIISQDITNNQSTIGWDLQVIKNSANTPSRSDSAPTWSFNYYGSGNWGPYSFNGAIGQTLTIAGPASFVVTHAADGTYTFTPSFAANALSTITTASGSGSVALDTIPRATQPTVTPTSGNTGSAFSIGVVPASSSFYHDIYYSLDGGATYTSIASNLAGTTTSQSWTPASTLLPNSSSVTAIIKVDTRSSSGGTIIGSATVNLPLTVPSTVVPTISAVAWVDTQTSAPDMPTLMGGAGRFVQGWSKLKPTVTAAGASGSTVTGSTVTQNGQTTPSGTAFGLPVALSGAVPFSAIATDSRSRDSAPFTGTVAVTAYNYPNLPTPTVTRTSDAAGTLPSPTGVYLAITPAASVSDLTFGGVQKNLLEWQVETRPAGGSWTTIQAWTNATVSGNTWTTKKVISGYASATAYEVRVSIRDLFGKNGYSTSSTVVSLTVPVASEFVFMDWDQGIGIGLGKYRQNGILDVHGDTYVDGVMHQGAANNPVVDTSFVASTSVAGIAKLSTDAQAIAGTDAATAVTPHALAAALAPQIASVRGRKDLIINGSFRINQRAYVSGTALTLNSYGFDRWKASTASTTCTFTAAPQGQQITLNSGGSIMQVIERANALAGTYTLSWTGTATARVYNSGATAPAYAASPITVTLDGLQNVNVEFAAVAATKTVGQVQLEAGSVATAYEVLTYGEELAQCQRYYWVNRAPAASQMIAGAGSQDTTTTGILPVSLPAPLRVAPTVTFGSLYWTNRISFSAIVSAVVVNAVGYTGGPVIELHPTYASAGSAGSVGFLVASAIGGFLALDAEL